MLGILWVHRREFERVDQMAAISVAWLVVLWGVLSVELTAACLGGDSAVYLAVRKVRIWAGPWVKKMVDE